MYKCECGKEFINSQSFNGHKSHCKIHYLSKYGNENQYNKMKESLVDRLKAGAEKYTADRLTAKNQKLLIWIDEKHVCEKCGKVMTEKFGSGRFCSSACAHSRNHSDEFKQKLSKINKLKYLADHPKASVKLVETSIKGKTKVKCNPTEKYLNNIPSYCLCCGIKLGRYNKTGYCRKCVVSAPERKEIRIQAGKKGYQTAVSHGVHYGWQTRNKTSYAERFFMKVLANNKINYIHEQTVRKADGINNYFLDFYIEAGNTKLDLEIDGKQHTYQDRAEHDVIRDKYLSTLGYTIYRISWNEINTEEGKVLMKEKISKFLDFYKSLLI